MHLCRNHSIEVLEKTFNVRPADKAEVNNLYGEGVIISEIMGNAIILIS